MTVVLVVKFLQLNDRLQSRTMAKRKATGQNNTAKRQCDEHDEPVNSTDLQEVRNAEKVCGVAPGFFLECAEQENRNAFDQIAKEFGFAITGKRFRSAIKASCEEVFDEFDSTDT